MKNARVPTAPQPTLLQLPSRRDSVPVGTVADSSTSVYSSLCIDGDHAENSVRISDCDDLHIGPSYPEQLSANTFIGEPALDICDDDNRNRFEPSPELSGRLLLPETDDQPQNSTDFASNGHVLSISNWRVLWGLLVTNGSLKLTKCQYQTMRVIADTFRRLADEADDEDAIERKLVALRRQRLQSLPHYSTLFRGCKPAVHPFTGSSRISVFGEGQYSQALSAR